MHKQEILRQELEVGKRRFKNVLVHLITCWYNIASTKIVLDIMTPTSKPSEQQKKAI